MIQPPLFPEPTAPEPVKVKRDASCSADEWCILCEGHPPPCKAKAARRGVLADAVVGDRLTISAPLDGGGPVRIDVVTRESPSSVWVGGVLYRRSGGSSPSCWIARPWQEGDDAIVEASRRARELADLGDAVETLEWNVRYAESDILAATVAEERAIARRIGAEERRRDAEAKLAAARAAVEALKGPTDAP